MPSNNNHNLIIKIEPVLRGLFEVDQGIRFSREGAKTVNDLFSFQIGNKKYLLKILTRPPRVKSDYFRFEKEVALIARLQQKNELAQKANDVKGIIPLQKVVHLERSEERAGYKFIVFEYIDGIPLASCWHDLTKEVKLSLVRELARILKNLHSLTFDMFGEIEDYDCPRRFYSFQSFLKANLHRDILLLGKRRIFPPKLLTDIQLFFEDKLRETNFSEQPQLVHADLNLTNILVASNNNQKIEALIDFEWAFAGDPLFDLFAIEDGWLCEPELKKTFYAVYAGDENFSLTNFPLERKIFDIFSLIETVAIGWLFFHPIKDSHVTLQKQLQKLLQE
ncbi:MAG: phosphotransferase family protein [Candidatus Heimdallarchaeota archaeon]